MFLPPAPEPLALPFALAGAQFQFVPGCLQALISTGQDSKFLVGVNFGKKSSSDSSPASVKERINVL